MQFRGQSTVGGSLEVRSRIDAKTESLQAKLLTLAGKRSKAFNRGSWWRAKFWGLIFSVFSEGVTTFISNGNNESEVTSVALARGPKLPDGPLIVIANHNSHADSALLLATIGRSRPVLIAAAADYWLADRAAELLATKLIGIWPIRRGENGWQDLAAAAPLVANDVVLVVFAEGSRSPDGSLQNFHSGAARLAQLVGATILPITINGTREVLGKNQTATKRALINLWHGEPIEAISPKAHEQLSPEQITSQAKSNIQKNVNEPLRDEPGFGFARVQKVAFGPVGLAICFLWALGEGISRPLIAEMPLLLLVVTVGWHRRGAALIASSAMGSALGIIITWVLVRQGLNPWSPLTTQAMFDYAQQQLATNPAAAFNDQMTNGIPVKVYAHEAGALNLSFAQLLGAIWPRLLRIVVVGAGGWFLGSSLRRWLRPTLGLVQLSALAIFPFGLWQSVAYWSH